MIDSVSLRKYMSSAGPALSIAQPSSAQFSNLLQNAVQTKTLQSGSMEEIFERAAQQNNVPVNLLKAVAKTESNFNADAVSSCGAQGVMQLMPSTARSLGVKDAFDAEQNIMGGAKYLGQMLSRYDGDAKLALAAYNAGSGNVAKYGGIPPFKETQNYVTKVMNLAGGNVTASGTFTTQAPSSSLPSGGTQDAVEAFSYSYDDYMLFFQQMMMQMDNSNLQNGDHRTSVGEVEIEETA